MAIEALALLSAKRAPTPVPPSLLYTGVSLFSLQSCALVGWLSRRSSKDAEEVAERIGKQYGVKTKAYQCDVGDENLVKETFKKIDDELGPITGVIAVRFSSFHPKSNRFVADLTTCIFYIECRSFSRQACT